MNYQTIKQVAKENPGIRVNDLIALAPANDPFYVGSPGELAKGRWFADLWSRFGYRHGVHLRRVHYQLVSQDPAIIKPTGDPYQNTTNDWAYLLQAAKAARYLNLVDPGAFVDRRNPNPIIFRSYFESGSPSYQLDTWRDADIQAPEWPELPDFTVTGFEVEQPYHLEIWVEKTTMNDVLEPICKQFQVNLITGAGELSITAALDFVKRVIQAGRPARIFYIADFDPAGHGMPVSVARKVEYFLQDLGLDLDIRLQPVALTLDQVREYRLPRTPIKPSELRKRRFENAFGTGAVELDALEALHPGLLAQIAREHVETYYDETLGRRVRDQYWAISNDLRRARTGVLEPFREELDELEATFQAAVDDFMSALGSITERLPDLYEEIRRDLNDVDVDVADYPLPDPKEADECDDVLFSSSRDYGDQLIAYKAYRNGSKG